jgi:hypothetical protein
MKRSGIQGFRLFHFPVRFWISGSSLKPGWLVASEGGEDALGVGIVECLNTLL